MAPSCLQPAAQLAGGLGGEGHGEHAVRPDDAGGDRVPDPVRDRPGLAGAGAGQHAHRAAGRQGDLPLLGVERGEQGVRSLAALRPVSTVPDGLPLHGTAWWPCVQPNLLLARHPAA